MARLPLLSWQGKSVGSRVGSVGLDDSIHKCDKGGSKCLLNAKGSMIIMNIISHAIGNRQIDIYVYTYEMN